MENYASKVAILTNLDQSNQVELTLYILLWWCGEVDIFLCTGLIPPPRSAAEVPHGTFVTPQVCTALIPGLRPA